MKEDKLDKFNFLIGNWNMESRIPKSNFSEAGTDKGEGSFKKILNDNYVLFEYSAESGGGAYGIFAWDKKLEIYRYWWFENSGNFDTSTCNFINDDTLAMNWHGSLFVQTFKKETPNKVVLKMKYPVDNDGYKCMLEVIFTK
ncbi:MAG: hypothetical protein O2U61_07505, partial [Candidatus Bathyarchaeota archaeon]|nr:hypothetical protein [Candidatus Bathyarchaeota archaeon]